MYRLIDIIYHGIYAVYIEYNGKVLCFAYSLWHTLYKMALFRAFPEEDKRMTGA